MLIQVLGTGCAKCNELEKLVKEVLAAKGSAATVEKVTDLQQIAMLGVFVTPGLVIDGVVKAAGAMPSRQDIEAWIG
jgi:small redox-active disulfide protein 2